MSVQSRILPDGFAHPSFLQPADVGQDSKGGKKGENGLLMLPSLFWGKEQIDSSNPRRGREILVSAASFGETRR